MKMLRYILLIGSVSLLNAEQAQPLNPLKKLFHHRTDKKHAESQLEVGNIILYFAREPIIKQRTKETGNQTLLTYFFPVTQFAGKEVQEMVERLNNLKDGLYSIKIASVSEPAPGIELTISYDPNKFEIWHDQFDAINKDKGVIIRMANKRLLTKLKNNQESVLKTAHAQKKGVIIDCGHGGADSGTIGIEGIKEKDVTLSIGLELARLLTDQNYTVRLTRADDKTVGLDDRTFFANTTDCATIFVSIHANWAANKQAAGLETFHVSSDLFKQPQASLTSWHEKLYQEASKLAQAIHTQVLSSAHQYGYELKDRTVKKAVSNVLVGTHIPSILVEVGFLSNDSEGPLLNVPAYQQQLAQGISRGIASFFDQRA